MLLTPRKYIFNVPYVGHTKVAVVTLKPYFTAVPFRTLEREIDELDEEVKVGDISTSIILVF